MDVTLHDLALDASYLVTQRYTGSDRSFRVPAELIRRSITKLPAAGRIHKKAEQGIVRALTWLIREVPTNTPDYAELNTKIDELRRRTPGV